MLKPPDVWVTANACAQVLEVLEQINMIEQGIGEPFRGSRMILPGPVHDRFEIR